MKKKITLLTLNDEIAPLLKKELTDIFDNLFEIDCYYPTNGPVHPIKNTDLILCHDPNLLVQMMPYIKCNAPTLMMKRTISNKSFKKLKKLPLGKKALIVSVNDNATLEILTTIFQLGINQLTLYPYSKNIASYPPVDYIVSSRDYDFIHDINAELVIIGKREFDISTILDIITIMEIDKVASKKIIERHSLKAPTFSHGIKATLEDKRVLSTKWNILLEKFSDAVIVCDENNEVTLINNKTSEVLGLPCDLLQGNKLENIVNQFPELKFFLSDTTLNSELIYFKGKQLVITIENIEYNSILYGKIIIINLYTNILKTQNKIHQKIIGKGHFSKYTFNDIIGKSPKLSEAVDICKKVADSCSTILFVGESGTGKELFAGATHNHSLRSKKPFVAVNCASIPENLLESELFGYDEGAFTGAKKDGKIGMFERANGGTLFLDEIGELPLKVQASLLRVLQEGQFMRVGGDFIIEINTRVITATNKDLLNMVEEGTFRKDLFYRINVFQIQIPTLKERVSDIPLLINTFMSNSNKYYPIEQDFQIFCNNYDWPGNIRELFNTLEYMTTISKENLSVKNMPKYLIKKSYLYRDKDISDITLLEYLLLKLLSQEDGERNTGRRSLHNYFCNIYYNISEVNIRKNLDSLAQKGYVKANKGRRGSEITIEGISVLGTKIVNKV
ncbi:sigma 54-interacting transcriptional regulator [Clostridium bowmanii]|uniref:sigma-54 interaction domain-containing protein n=1 Tax=Clostridium bowmanii TaxID=132925 RepID=UPI001C0C1457|nr:sigma 54-interacting transcriptional regulator [Clostridium bowmanii]MBU3191525.1 sigma 54-interacting transcriptional regulator [Clostridium bowmanii]MCA1075876.1 sigma 54-interacting transcriptional regulator [Clostridium bowmanii]